MTWPSAAGPKPTVILPAPNTRGTQCHTPLTMVAASRPTRPGTPGPPRRRLPHRPRHHRHPSAGTATTIAHTETSRDRTATHPKQPPPMKPLTPKPRNTPSPANAPPPGPTRLRPRLHPPRPSRRRKRARRTTPDRARPAHDQRDRPHRRAHPRRRHHPGHRRPHRTAAHRHPLAGVTVAEPVPELALRFHHTALGTDHTDRPDHPAEQPHPQRRPRVLRRHRPLHGRPSPRCSPTSTHQHGGSTENSRPAGDGGVWPPPGAITGTPPDDAPGLRRIRRGPQFHCDQKVKPSTRTGSPAHRCGAVAATLAPPDGPGRAAPRTGCAPRPRSPPARRPGRQPGPDRGR